MLIIYIKVAKPLEIKLVLKPETPINKILVRVTACSLCNSDVSGWQGHVGVILPYCGGHERKIQNSCLI